MIPHGLDVLLRIFADSLSGRNREPTGTVPSDQSESLLQVASIHGLIPWLLAQRQLIAVATGFPVSDWRLSEQHNRLRVLANWAATLRALDILAAGGIPAVPIKGVAISQQLHGNPWMRPAGDVDLLIERRHVQRSHALLLEAGFPPGFPEGRLTKRQWRWILDTHHDIGVRNSSGLLIELQWRLHDNALLDYRDEEWAACALDPTEPRLEVLGRQVPRLPPPITYLLTMSHLARTGWSRLLWVLDAWLAWKAALVAHPLPDLEAIIERHGATGLHHRFMALMDQLLAEAPPAQWPPRGYAPRLARSPRAVTESAMATLLFRLELKKSARYKLSVLRDYLVSPSDFSVVRIPDWAFWLYAPLRFPLFVYRKCATRWAGHKE